jgi:hypothetical protein
VIIIKYVNFSPSKDEHYESYRDGKDVKQRQKSQKEK